jgi:DNA-binding protein YbaB
MPLQMRTDHADADEGADAETEAEERSPMTAQEEAIRDYLVGLQGDAHERASQARLLAERTDALRVDGWDESRLVTATVDSTGHLVDLRITEQAHRLGPDQLSTRILRATENASGRLTVQVSRLAEQTLGADSPSAQLMGRSYEQRFGRVEDDDPTTGQPR